jgi:hypothetical protein
MVLSMNKIKKIFVEQKPLSISLICCFIGLFVLIVSLILTNTLNDVVIVLLSLILSFLSILISILFILILITIYILPIIIAIIRKHNNLSPVILVNIFFGWSVIGWIVSLIWSTSDNVK